MNPVAIALFAFGYPVAIVVLARWWPVVRERRWRWFAAHQAAVAAIVTGWIVEGGWPAAAINGAWAAVAACWFVRAGAPTRP